MITQNVKEFAASMARIEQDMLGIVPDVLDTCKPHVLENIYDNFANEQSPDGVAWEERKIIGDGHPLLFDTESLFNAAVGLGSGHVSRIEGDTLVTGVDKDGGIGGVPGAGVHNYGFREKNIPQREFLGVSEQTTDLLANVISDKFLTKITG